MTDGNRNLLVRLVTALVLLPIVLWLCWQGGLWFTLLISVAASLCALELNQLFARAQLRLPVPTADAVAEKELTRKERKAVRAPAALPKVEADAGAGEGSVLSGAAIASVGAAFLLPLLDHAPLGFLSAKMVFVALVFIAFADALFFEPDLARAPGRVSVAVLGAAYPGLLLSALVRLRQLDAGEYWLLLALTVTWINDTGAYFTGRAFGRHRLYPRISPSKTVEGALGGLLFSIAGALAVKLLFLPALPLWGAAVIGAGGAVLGPLGDLSESMLKRAWGAKDSGRMLPGHGGFLDRIDALLFNAPFVLLCARLFAR